MRQSPNPTRRTPASRRRCARRPTSTSPPAERPYDRNVELARVLPLWPHEIDDMTAQGRWRVIARLRRALRAERRRGIAGHWTYDLGRHMELLRVYRRELAALAAAVVPLGYSPRRDSPASVRSPSNSYGIAPSLPGPSQPARE